ncbi:DNA repair protein RecO [Gammaproteobacteria bacterium]|nr:DNA repair protein RecO [Gammaproteobacteria bacterium]
MKSLGANETEAILLLSRKFSETSLICELFTRKNGRVSVIAKGARSKKNKFQNVAAPNILANINYSGKNELKTLTSWEEIKYFQILGKNLKILLYLNELLFKLIEKEVKQEKIFDAVINFYKILELGEAKNIEISLREFEYFFICELGYGFDFQFDDEGKGIQKERIYYFHPAQGFSEKPLNNFLKVSGIDIINFSNGKITSSSARSKIKKIMQIAITYIAEKPMNAGAIFND